MIGFGKTNKKRKKPQSSLIQPKAKKVKARDICLKMDRFILKDSVPCIKSELDLSVTPSIQTAIEKHFFC